MRLQFLLRCFPKSDFQSQSRALFPGDFGFVRKAEEMRSCSREGRSGIDIWGS